MWLCRNFPVIFCLDRSGLVGEDGATHHGVFDLAYLRCIPNLILFAPRNEIELRNIMYTAQLGLDQPIAIRYPRGRGSVLDWKQPFSKIEIGKGEQLKEGHSLAVLSIGTVSETITEALNNVSDKDAVAHYDMRFVKPLDEGLLHRIFAKYTNIVTLEDGTISGGFGSALLEFASMHNYKNTIQVLGVPDQFVNHGSKEQLQAYLKIDTTDISTILNTTL